MKLSELETHFRHRAGDQAKPYLFSSIEVRRWLNEAEAEACKRGDLIREDRDASLTQLAVAAEGFPADLDEKWCRITHAEYVVPSDDDDSDPQRIPLEIFIDRRALDAKTRHWRTDVGRPWGLLIEGSRLRLACLPEAAGTLTLEGFRQPIEPMRNDMDEPEIDSIHHLRMIDWALHLAFSKPDSEMRDTGRAQQGETDFAAYFGPARDSAQAQDTEVQPFNIPVW